MLTLSPNSYTGLEADTQEEQELIKNFYTFYNTVTQKEPSARNYYFNTSSINLAYKPYILGYVWNKIYEQLETKRQLQITGRGLNYATPTQGSSEINCKMTLNWNAPNPQHTEILEKPYSIRITYIVRGMAIFEELTTHLTAETRLNRLETLLTKDRYHKCRIYKDQNNTVHYVTNKWDNNDIFKLIGMLPVFYDDLLTNPTEPSEAMQLCATLYNNGTPQADLSMLVATLLKDTANLAELSRTRILDAFTTNLTRASSANVINMKQDLESKKRSIENLYLDIFQREQAAYTLAQQIFAAELCPTAIDPAVIDFLKRTQAIKLIECDNTYAVWEVFTPITNYNRADVEMFFKRTEHNVFNNPDWLGKLIIATFIEEKYQLMTDTQIGMHWTDYANWRKYPDDAGRFGNPHITNFNCFSATKQAVHKAMRDGQMLSAINMIIAAAATITFTDGAVTERLALALKGYAKTYKIFKDVATGEMISAADFINILTAKETAKTTATTATESTTIDLATATTYPPDPFI